MDGVIAPQPDIANVSGSGTGSGSGSGAGVAQVYVHPLAEQSVNLRQTYQSADRSDRYMQCIIRDADGKETPLFSSADGTVHLTSLNGDFPLLFRPLKLNLPPIKKSQALR